MGYLNRLDIKKLCLLYLMFCGEGYYVLLGDTSLPSIVKLRPVDEVLIGATVRNIRGDGIQVTVSRRIGTFDQA